MLNAQQNVYINSSFRSNIANSEYEEVLAEIHPTEYEEVVEEIHPTEYEEVVAEYHTTEYEEVIAEYHSTDYEEAHSIQRVDTSNAIHIALSSLPPRHQKIHTSLWFLCLIIICSLIAIVLTGVVTFLVTRETLPKTKYQDADETNCYWSSWSSWYTCSVTCGNGVQIRIKQHMNHTKLCSYNETFDSKTCHRGECTDARTKDCDWLPWSTCDNGVKVRIRQKTYNARICGFNDTFEAQTCSGNRDIFDMRFSRTALHKNMFISADYTIISNVHTNDTSSSADAQLKNYQGTISDHCVGDNELNYYEVNYTYTIVKALTDDNLVLEVGLAERSKVDQFYYGGSNNVSAWTFHLSKQSNIDSVYLYAQYRVNQKTSRSFSKTTVGTNIHGKFKLFINRRRNEFLMTQDDSIIHVYKNVTSTGKLCPIFGVYNPHSVHVKLQLMNPRNFTYYPW